MAQVLTDSCAAAADDVQYAFVASRDGLVVAAASTPTQRDEDQTALRGSAIAAAAAGIGDHFIALSSRGGRLQSVLFEADRSCVAVLPLSSALLLVVGGTQATSLGRLSAAARRMVHALQTPAV
ncbi:roadblock/LC7 domain-containing protein [Nocardia sp. alder85J]|uniref:roadblock/LC7 domain-containing protein n=1 Tax=Nocardia sp. alder85J TaxID=2862949 RepID=UPI001CD19AAF|nr:roadblock/LC7 domain-containing protein [Nocardia sp. alder85J]MCX4098369.1 roadblock/LC7 domain-containing protein [Nocardia sp. alder85J]